MGMLYAYWWHQLAGRLFANPILIFLHLFFLVLVVASTIYFLRELSTATVRSLRALAYALSAHLSVVAVVALAHAFGTIRLETPEFWASLYGLFALCIWCIALLLISRLTVGTW